MIGELGTKLFSQVSIILSLDYSPASAYSLNAFRNVSNSFFFFFASWFKTRTHTYMRSCDYFGHYN